MRAHPNPLSLNSEASSRMAHALQRAREIADSNEDGSREAAELLALQAVEQGLAEGASPDAQDKVHGCVLGSACSRGLTAAVAALLDAGAHPDGAGPNAPLHVPPIIQALGPHGLASLRLLLAAGADPSHIPWRASNPGGEQPLLAAARLGRAEHAAALLDAGADPRARYRDLGCLMSAAAHGHERLLRALLSRAGARDWPCVDDKTKSGLRAIDLAIQTESEPCARTLAQAGADLGPAMEGGPTAAQQARFRNLFGLALFFEQTLLSRQEAQELGHAIPAPTSPSPTSGRL